MNMITLDQQTKDAINTNLKDPSFLNQLNLLIERVRLFYFQSDGLIKVLKLQNFDMLVANSNYQEIDYFKSILEIKTIVKLGFNFANSQYATHNGGIRYVHTAEVMEDRAFQFGLHPANSIVDYSFSFGTRLQNFIIQILQQGPFKWYLDHYLKKAVPEEQHQYLQQVKNQAVNMTLIEDIEGLSAPLILPGNIKFVYPFAKKSIQPEVQPLQVEIKEFIDKNNKIFVIYFNEENMIESDKLKNILQYTLNNYTYQFIIGNLNYSQLDNETQNSIKDQANITLIQNLNIASLISHPKIQIIMTFGDQKQVIDMIENEKPLMILPVYKEHFFSCELVQMRGIGQCISDSDSDPIEIQRKVEYIEQNNFYKYQLQIFNKVIKEKKNDKLDLLYWFNYTFEVGTEHLQIKQFNDVNILSLFEIDLLIAIVVIFQILIYFIGKIFGILTKVFKCKRFTNQIQQEQLQQVKEPAINKSNIKAKKD